MSLLDAFPCKLSNFEGPLDYLLYLVQQGEIVLADVPLWQVTQQFIDSNGSAGESHFEVGAEFVGAASTLMWLKSKALLPPVSKGTPAGEEESFSGVKLEALQQLVEYCRLKKGALALNQCEEAQQPHYYRGFVPTPAETSDRPLGLEVGLDELAALFTQALKRAAPTASIQADRWQVADALADVRQQLAERGPVALATFFTGQMCRTQVIVTFLALLELMKGGELTLTADGTCQRRGHG